MTGSVAIDIVLGLVFIYLLYSLLATVLGEIIAVHLGLRARVLKQGLQRMLEDNPETSEQKIIAFYKNLVKSIKSIFTLPEGPATCVFYNIPLIKYLGKNTFQSKPSYISKQNFSKTMLEIFRKYGGSEDKSDVEKIKFVLNGSFAYERHLFELKEIIRTNTFDEQNKPINIVNYKKIRILLKTAIDKIDLKDIHDIAQKKILGKIKKRLLPGFQFNVDPVEHCKLVNSDCFAALAKEEDMVRLIQTFDVKDQDNANLKFVIQNKKLLRTTEKEDKKAIYKIDQILNLFGRETKSHLLSLLKDADEDISKFRHLLEQWFDDTMERATGWYKEKIQLILFIIGLGLSIAFNASTLEMVSTLSKDKSSRDQLVAMASAYMSNHKKSDLALPDSGDARLDSLLLVKKTIENDIQSTRAILGLGWNFPDSLSLVSKEIVTQQLAKKSIVQAQVLEVFTDTSKKNISYILLPPNLDKKSVISLLRFSSDCIFYFPFVKSDLHNSLSEIKNHKVKLSKFKYCLTNIWGYVLTAIAISLGAPFWFDLLNKLMQLRGALKGSTEPIKAKSGKYYALSDPKH